MRDENTWRGREVVMKRKGWTGDEEVSNLGQDALIMEENIFDQSLCLALSLSRIIIIIIFVLILIRGVGESHFMCESVV